MKLIGQKTYPNTEAGYRNAEKFADQWAGDNSGYAVVVEDLDNDKLHVMDEGDSRGFMAEWESHIIYYADHRTRCHVCENMVTGQRIRSRDRDYCSFVCLDKGSKPKASATVTKGDIITIVPEKGEVRTMRVAHVEHHIITLSDLD
jgi:hypothetical protein